MRPAEFLAETGVRGGAGADDAQPRAGRRGGERRDRPRRWDGRQAVDPFDDRLELLALGCGHGEVELEDAEPGFGGIQEHIRIREPREQRQVERGEKALERLVNRVRFAHAVRHHRDADVVGPDFPGQQQVANEIGGGVNVDRRGRYRDENAVSARQHFLQRQSGHAGRRIADELPRVRRDMHAGRAEPRLLRRGVRAVDLARVQRTHAQPIERRALRVVIHHRSGNAVRGEVTGEIGRDGGLTRPPLRIDHQCGIGPHSPPAAYPGPTSPGSNYCSSCVENSRMKELIVRAERVAALLTARKETVAVAESSAGGLITAALLGVPGASAYCLGGIVIYTRQGWEALRDFDQGLLGGYRSATEQNALIRARLARDRFGAAWGVGETGAAGPTGNRYGDPAGHACLAVSGGKEIATTLRTGSSDRLGNMHAFAAAALGLLEESL